jgi:hypothetical protein
MTTVRVTAATIIDAPAATVYRILADYREGHPSILPPRYFEDFQVEAGGQGGGTRIRFTMRSYGRRVPCRAEVTEPEPGRVLVETDPSTGTTTRFVVEALEARRCRVTFETDYHARGLRGWLESRFVPGYLRAVYAEELELLRKTSVSVSASASR